MITLVQKLNLRNFCLKVGLKSNLLPHFHWLNYPNFAQVCVLLVGLQTALNCQTTLHFGLRQVAPSHGQLRLSLKSFLMPLIQNAALIIRDFAEPGHLAVSLARHPAPSGHLGLHP